MKKFIFVCLLFVFSPVFSKAQTRLSANDLEGFKKQARQRIADFEHYAKKIIDEKDEKSRSIIVNHLIRLFRNDATIEVSGRKSGTRKISINNYANNTLVNYGKGNKLVVLEFTTVRINDNSFVEKRDDKGNIYYEGSYNFVQKFCRKNTRDVETSNLDYCDETEKKGVIVIQRGPSINGSRWRLLLGDIKVEHIE